MSSASELAMPAPHYTVRRTAHHMKAKPRSGCLSQAALTSQIDALARGSRQRAQNNQIAVEITHIFAFSWIFQRIWAIWHLEGWWWGLRSLVGKTAECECALRLLAAPA